MTPQVTHQFISQPVLPHLRRKRLTRVSHMLSGVQQIIFTCPTKLKFALVAYASTLPRVAYTLPIPPGNYFVIRWGA